MNDIRPEWVEAGASAECHASPACEKCRQIAEGIIEAAEPLIRADERERLAYAGHPTIDQFKGMVGEQIRREALADLRAKVAEGTDPLIYRSAVLALIDVTR